MPNSIQLQPSEPRTQSVSQPFSMARSTISASEIETFFDLVISADSPFVVLPEGKQTQDIQTFSLARLANGQGVINVKFFS